MKLVIGEAKQNADLHCRLRRSRELLRYLTKKKKSPCRNSQSSRRN